MTKPRLRKVAFLDTNVLHYISLYLRQAKDNGLFPFGGDVLSARKRLDEIEYKSLKSSLNKGLDVIEHLRSKDCRAEYSFVSELELMAGRARGRAIEKAAGEGIPEQMWWSRFTESDVGDRLVDSDLTTIGETVEELRRLINEAGIDIDATDVREGRSRDVLKLAKCVMGIVYMSAMDSMVYAGALVAEADNVISYDDYLKKTVNRLKNKESLLEARQRLAKCTADVLSREPNSITLPGAKAIPRGTP